MFACIRLAFVTVPIFLGIPSSKGGANSPTAGPAAKLTHALSDSWKLHVELPTVEDGSGNVLLHAAKINLWIEKGWLIVRRETDSGDIEWQIVVAQATEANPPQVTVDKVGGGFEITYGRYFVREGVGLLRVLRERKTAQSPPWPKRLADHGSAGLGSASNAANVHLTGWEVSDWCWVASGLPGNQYDVWLRLEHKALRSPGYSFHGKPQLAQMFYGTRRVQDEGDLLVAERSLAETVEAALLAKKLQKEMGNKPAPALAVKEWFNTTDDPTLDKLNGKVVLLDFWGKWCSPCVKKLPDVEGLHQKYKDRGLVVIGIHSTNDSEKLGEFLKEKKITFAVGVDKGATTKNYAIGAWPTYFLIDKTGKVVWGFSAEPPKGSQIEELLR